jgi:hypothetical protein
MARPIQIALRVPAIRFGLIPYFTRAENRLQSSNRNDQDGCGFRRKGDRQRDLFECFFHGLFISAGLFHNESDAEGQDPFPRSWFVHRVVLAIDEQTQRLSLESSDVVDLAADGNVNDPALIPIHRELCVPDSKADLVVKGVGKNRLQIRLCDVAKAEESSG